MLYYKAESASKQDEVNPAFWLATWAGKMGQSCLLRISHVGPSSKCSLFGHIINLLIIVQAYLVKMNWILTSTSSWSIKMQKRTNIQPSWPHAWSITHNIYLTIIFHDIMYIKRLLSYNFFIFILCLYKDQRIMKELTDFCRSLKITSLN